MRWVPMLMKTLASAIHTLHSKYIYEQLSIIDIEMMDASHAEFKSDSLGLFQNCTFDSSNREL